MFKKLSMPLTLKKSIILTAVLIIAAGLGVFVFINQIKTIDIVLIDGTVIKAKTTAKTVGDILKEYNIVLQDTQKTEPPMDAVVNSKGTIKIEYREGQGENITQSQKLDIKDIINKTEIIEKVETVIEELPFETIGKNDTDVNDPNARIVTKGKNGEREVTYKVRYENGVSTAKVELASKVTKEPVNKVVEAKTVTIASRGDNSYRSPGAPEHYKAVYTVRTTGYCLCSKCTGKSPSSPGYGRTASGYVITPGKGEKVIAVDPNLIPLGSKVYIQGPNGKDYGYATAVDTGGAIKGNKVDLYVDNHSDAFQWTAQGAKLYIIE